MSPEDGGNSRLMDAMSLGLLEGLCPVNPQGFFGTARCFVADWDLPILTVLLLAVLWVAAGIVRKVRQKVDTRFVLPIKASDAPAKGHRPSAHFSEAEYESQRAAMRQALSPLRPMPLGGDPAERLTFKPGSLRAPGNGGPKAAHGVEIVLAAPRAPEPGPKVATEEPDGTLQLLPGRLEVERGPGRGEDIRFVRIPGLKQEITLGRAPGPIHRHVQLESATVSRTHARLTFRDGSWTLRNESSTNPTIYNGRPLNSAVEEVPLRDGDRIELGEVILIFRQDAPADRLAFRSSWYTDRGRRAVNQDAVVVRTLPGGRELAAVCDGMGSHTEGGLASHVALEALVTALSEGSPLVDAVEKANHAVLEAAGKSPDRNGMGTTLVAMLRDGEGYEIANVGDSRAYRVDASGITQVTRDHSFLAEAMQAGRMSEEEAQQSPWKNAVTRSLGADAVVQVDVFGRYDASRAGLIILCTDGVHGVLEATDVLDIVKRTQDVRDLARTLGEQALINGGEDNVAVAAVRFAWGAGGGSNV